MYVPEEKFLVGYSQLDGRQVYIAIYISMYVYMYIDRT